MADDDTSGKPPPLMGATAIRPPDRVGAEKYTYILYDPKNGTVLTRTPKSWALIIVFYCIYYSCLAAFWIACMTIFLSIQIQDPLDPKIKNAKPTWTQGDSIIGINPGFGVRPAQTAEQVDSGIFDLTSDFTWTVATDAKTIADEIKKDIEKLVDDKKLKKGQGIEAIAGSKGYAYRAFDFFKLYRDNENTTAVPDGIDCTIDNEDSLGYRDTIGKFCRFNRTTLSDPCQNFPYGYAKGDDFKPCVFLKLNRIMDLKPKPINGSNVNEQDASLLEDPSSKIFLDELKAAVPPYPAKVFIKCEGAYPADKEALKGNMKMFPPSPGLTNAAAIPLKYFPYDQFRKGRNESPLVAIQFSNLAKNPGRLIHIICKSYYDGVVHSKKKKAGLVKFEIYLNDEPASDGSGSGE